MDSTNYWTPVEEQWRRNNLSSLKSHLECCNKTHHLIAKLGTHDDIVKEPMGEMLGVSRLLLRRLCEELRAVELLAELGHGFQSATAACNLFEQSHYLTYVGIGIDEAKKFIEWQDRNRSIIRVSDLVKTSGNARGWNEERCYDEYEKYRFLCGFKHNNPVFQRILKLPSDPDLYMGQFALAESIWSCSTAVALFAMEFLEVEYFNDFIDELNPIMDEAKTLSPALPESKATEG